MDFGGGIFFSGGYNLTTGVFPLPAPGFIEYLAVAGGGGGGAAGTQYYDSNGGGGAGGMLEGNITLSYPQTLLVTVGAGGSVSSNGANSNIFGEFTATAVGGGRNAQPGGSGGGSNGNGGGAGYGAGVSGQGNRGGSGDFIPAGGNAAGGGGGGAGGVGGDAGYYGSPPGVGGVGKQSSITGSSIYYAGGGGGNGVGGSVGYGSSLGGGGGATQDGTSNLGGGGGAKGGLGGSGVVVLRYLDTFRAGTTTGSPNVTVSSGYRIYRFWQSGTITF